MKMSDLQNKTIVSIKDGRNIGKISDLEIDNKGIIINFFALPRRRLFRIFSSSKEEIFTMNQIVKIGEDVILVELN